MTKKLTVEDFIRKAREVHGDKYDYTKVKYVNIKTKVCIICPEHGEFWQTPKTHLHSHGCSKCGKESMWNKRGRITTEKFIARAKAVHGDKYDYSKVEYKDFDTKVCIICPEHGDFYITPNNLIYGRGCAICGKKKQLQKLASNKEEFAKKAAEIHDDKYDYSKIEYVNCKTKVCIICQKHGEFWQTPKAHLTGQGCPKCSGHAKLTTEEFIHKAKEVHGDRYDYSKVEYMNPHTKVCIICPEHGEIRLLPFDHLRGNKCPKCRGLYKTTNDFIKEAREIHGDKYDYSRTEYVNSNVKVRIICPEHGEFWQLPYHHLSGCGCPFCNESHLERDTAIALKAEGVQFKRQSPIGRQRLDFYLPEFNAAIECQGEQHYRPVGYFGRDKKLAMQKEWDKLKKEKCVAQGIKLFEITYRDKKDVARKVKEIVENLRKEKHLNVVNTL